MTVRIITDSNGRKHITNEPLLHQPAPVMTDEKGRPVSFWGGKSVEPIAQPAPVQPVWIQPDHLQKAQKAPFLCRVEPHKRDDFVPLYTTPPAQPAPVQPVGTVKDLFTQAAWEKLDARGSTKVYLATPPAAQPAVQEPVAWARYPRYTGSIQKAEIVFTKPEGKDWLELYTTPPAQPAVQEPLGYLEIDDIESQREYPHNCRNVNLWHEGGQGMAAIYTTPPAQPTVPDALFRHAPEHPQYIEGWNDCRAEMLKGLKP